MGLHTYKRIGHNDLPKGQSVKSIVSSIDLIRPPVKYSLKMSCLDLKSTPKHGKSIPLAHCITVRRYGIFHDVSMGLETFWVVGEYLCWTHPLKLPYLDT